MWDVAPGVDDGIGTLVPPDSAWRLDTAWRVATIRLEFGPAPTIGALLAALSEVLTFSRLLPYDLEFREAPEGTYMFTYCELPHRDVGIVDTLEPLLPIDAIGEGWGG